MLLNRRTLPSARNERDVLGYAIQLSADSAAPATGTMTQGTDILVGAAIGLPRNGDAMEPTLRSGDSVLVDCAQKRPQRTDGIYVIRTDGALQVKRLQVEVVQGLLTILSDNKAYEVQRGVRPDDVTVVGRVIWLGRALGS